MTTASTKTKKPKTVAPKKEKAKKTAPAKKEKVIRAEKKIDSEVVLRIRVRAYESKILDASVKQIIDTAMRYDAVIVGPVPLPTEIKKYTVNRSAFIYKNAREQFEIRVHKRLIDIINPNAKTIEALTNLSLPSGVDIDVKMM
jgi:small subunit ribosomal protein S10